jgi:hypothetical protein
MKLEKNWKEGEDISNRNCLCIGGTISGGNIIKIVRNNGHGRV